MLQVSLTLKSTGCLPTTAGFVHKLICERETARVGRLVCELETQRYTLAITAHAAGGF